MATTDLECPKHGKEHLHKVRDGAGGAMLVCNLCEYGQEPDREHDP